MTEKKTKPDIYDAILDIYKEGKLYAQKASRNTAQSYNYTSEADFLALMRPQLAAHDIVCHPAYDVISSGEMTTKSGAVMQTITLKGKFTFVHCPSGTSVEVITIGQGTDQQDKAAYKAMTGAQKYAIRQAFLIETGDDPEKDDVPEPAPHPEPSPQARFLSDLEHELKRIGPEKYRKVVAKLFPDLDDGSDLTALSKENKRLLITTLRETPPF